MPKKPSPLINRFMSKVEMLPLIGCWLWTGATDSSGYGLMSSQRGKAPYRSHRIAYELFVGDIPEGNVVRHICDNPNCVNPNHLEAGTQKDNALDTSRRKRLNPTSFLNLRPGKLGFHGAGPLSTKELRSVFS